VRPGQQLGRGLVVEVGEESLDAAREVEVAPCRSLNCRVRWTGHALPDCLLMVHLYTLVFSSTLAWPLGP
jgi:hypothetical protein